MCPVVILSSCFLLDQRLKKIVSQAAGGRLQVGAGPARFGGDVGLPAKDGKTPGLGYLADEVFILVGISAAGADD